MGFEWLWILFFLPLPLLFQRARKQSADAIEIPPRLANQLVEVGRYSDHGRLYQQIIFWVAWVCLLVAIAQPYTRGESKAQPANGRTLIVAIDLSASMERKDFVLDGQQVDRLTVVKQIAGRFIDRRRGDRVGLVLFGSEAFVASPPSFDLSAVKLMLHSAGTGMAGRTTAIGDALGLAIQSLRKDPATDKAIILLSDGTNNAGTAEPEGAARLADDLGIRIHTIGLGSEGSEGGTSLSNTFYTTAAADLDEAALQSIAEAASGEFFRAHTTDELEAIYNEIDQLEGADAIAPPVVIKRDIRNYFVLVVFLCALLEILSRLCPGIFVSQVKSVGSSARKKTI